MKHRDAAVWHGSEGSRTKALHRGPTWQCPACVPVVYSESYAKHKAKW